MNIKTVLATSAASRQGISSASSLRSSHLPVFRASPAYNLTSLHFTFFKFGGDLIDMSSLFSGAPMSGALLRFAFFQLGGDLVLGALSSPFSDAATSSRARLGGGGGGAAIGRGGDVINVGAREGPGFVVVGAASSLAFLLFAFAGVLPAPTDSRSFLLPSPNDSSRSSLRLMLERRSNS